MKQSITASEMGKPVTLSRLTELTGSTKVSTRISDLRMHGYVIHNTRPPASLHASPSNAMDMSEIRADLIQAIDESMTNLLLVCESSDNDDVILVADAAGNRYKLTITELPPI